MSGSSYVCHSCGAENGPADVFCYRCEKRLGGEPDPVGRAVGAITAVTFFALFLGGIALLWLAIAAPPGGVSSHTRFHSIRWMYVLIWFFFFLMTMKGSFWESPNVGPFIPGRRLTRFGNVFYPVSWN
jgi:hypothetical protein